MPNKLIKFNNKVRYILIVIVVLIIIGIYKYIYISQIVAKTQNIEDTAENFTNYQKCSHLGLHKNIKTVFEENDIERSKKTNTDWDVYLPCGYNYVEGELNNIKITNSKQKVFAIKGCDNIASKNNLWKILRDYYGRRDASNIMPESYIISDKNDMKIFEKNYEPSKLYLLKKNVQRKEGIMLAKDIHKIMKIKNDYKVIQEYINDLYLIQNRKINLRIYLLLICKNGITTGYLYNEGKCIYTNQDYKEYDGNLNANKLREQHLTSVNLDTNIYNTHPESFKDLRYNIGYFNYNILWNNINKLFKKLLKAIQGNVCQSNNLSKILTFQLFGADIIFTSKFHPYLLELNKGPSMKYMTDTDQKMKEKLTRDLFTLVGIANNGNSRNFIKIN